MKTLDTNLYFSQEQLNLLNSSKVPFHIAIIPDGNRRWARERGLHISEGHRKGADHLITLIEAAKILGVKTVTFFLFSTENWMRDQKEVEALLWLLEFFLVEQRQVMIDKDVRFEVIGDLNKFPDRILNAIQETKQATINCHGINMVAALNYGGRDEMTRAVRRLLEDLEAKKLTKEAVDEFLISRYLDTAPWSDPQLLIRTGGEKRVSNFLLWQISYAEIYTDESYWPDFTPSHLLKALLYYQARERRLGG